MHTQVTIRGSHAPASGISTHRVRLASSTLFDASAAVPLFYFLYLYFSLYVSILCVSFFGYFFLYRLTFSYLTQCFFSFLITASWLCSFLPITDGCADNPLRFYSVYKILSYLTILFGCTNLLMGQVIYLIYFLLFLENFCHLCYLFFLIFIFPLLAWNIK